MSAAVVGLTTGLVAASVLLEPASAAQIAPPMFDVTRQCEATYHRNATAMSECVVAESEARSDILQGWSKLPDGEAERCIKFGRKAKRLPYTAMAKCLGPEAAPAPAGAKPSAKQ